MTAGVWVAEVPRPLSVPLEQVHVMLYSYFPATQHGQGRPYVWRLLAPDRIGVVSAARPTCNAARLRPVEAGRTYQFTITYKRTRNVAPDCRPGRVEQRRDRRTVTMTSMQELRERLVGFAGARGGAVGYVRLDRQRDVRLPGAITLPIVDAEGQVLVTDPARFVALLASGGPGTGKAYGCGAWWLPELMAS